MIRRSPAAGADISKLDSGAIRLLAPLSLQPERRLFHRFGVEPAPINILAMFAAHSPVKGGKPPFEKKFDFWRNAGPVVL